MKRQEEYKYKSKGYLHFDDKRVYNKETENYVKKTRNIETHRFYPLIKFKMRNEKYYSPTSDDYKDEEFLDIRPFKKSTRTIMYASHIDNFIYKHYAEELNKQYNKFVFKNNIDENVTAYRSKENTLGKSNIHYAAEVIHTIRESESSYILVGDFKSYFDTLNHERLKSYLCKVQEDNQLSEDWYKVFRSVTKYSYYNKRTINKYRGSDNKLKQLKQSKYFINPQGFRKFKKLYPIQTNKESFGIPQGTAISALLSNVYSIQFDMAVKELTTELEGMYRRYSDDFIIIIPHKSLKTDHKFKLFEQRIRSLVEKEQLEIREDKTELYHYRHGTIINLKEDKQDHLDYLGFVFDGVNVKMRAKSPSKFYRNAYKLINKAKKIKSKKKTKKLPYRKSIYGLYTNMGLNRGSFGNFITYAKDSQSIFDEMSPQTNNLMMQQIKHRKRKIENKLEYRIHVKND